MSTIIRRGETKRLTLAQAVALRDQVKYDYDRLALNSPWRHSVHLRLNKLNQVIYRLSRQQAQDEEETKERLCRALE